MKPYFKTTIRMEDLSKDDISILQKDLGRFNLLFKIIKYILLIAVVLFAFLFLPFTYNKNIDSFVAEYYFAIGCSLSFIVLLTSIAGMFFIYHKFVVEQALNNNYVVVCTGVLTRSYFLNEFHIFIGSVHLSLDGNVKKKALKVGTCIQCRFVGTHTAYHCISMKRYDQIMYDPEHILQVERRDLELDMDILMMYSMLEEIVNYQMFQVEAGKKNGIKGILLAAVCRFWNPFYKVEYVKGQGKTVKIPDLSDYKNKLNKKKEAEGLS